MDTMRCAIYARYSSDLQRDRSIEDQIRNCQRHADQNGWLVLSGHIYSDRAMSGASTFGRTGLERLLREAEASPRPFDYVLIDDTSRLSRKMGEVDTIVERLRFHGIHVYFVSQGIDSRDTQSHLTVGVNSLIDSQYRRDLASKTLRGMTGQALKGYNAGGRVYGYQYVKEFDQAGTKDRKTGQVRIIGSRVKVDPQQSELVREIFQLYADGLSIRDITYHLNNKGYPPPHNARQAVSRKGKPAWIPNTVRDILSNEKYIGDWTFNKTGWVTNPETGQRKRIVKDRSEWVENPQPALAIIDRATWDKVQQRILKNKRGPQTNRKGVRSRFLFSGLMKCHECGGSYVLVSSSDRRNPLFGCCTNWNRGRAACSNNLRVGKDEIERTILSDIQKDLLSPAVLSALVNETNHLLKAKLAKLRRESSGIVTEEVELRTKLGNVIAAIESGAYSDALQRRLTEIETRLAEMENKHDLLGQSLRFERLKVDESWVSGWLGRLRGLLETDPERAKAKIMALMGTFMLSPEIIEGTGYLRVSSDANFDGLIRVATGDDSPKNGILGGGVEPPTS